MDYNRDRKDQASAGKHNDMIDPLAAFLITLAVNVVAVFIAWYAIRVANERHNDRRDAAIEKQLIEIAVRVDTLWSFFIHDATGAARRAGIVDNPAWRASSVWRTMTRDGDLDRRLRHAITQNWTEVNATGETITAQTMADMQKELIALAAKHKIRPSAMIGLVAALVNAQVFKGGWIVDG